MPGPVEAGGVGRPSGSSAWVVHCSPHKDRERAVLIAELFVNRVRKDFVHDYRSWTATSASRSGSSKAAFATDSVDQAEDGRFPMPSASVSTATAVKPGFFSNWRIASRSVMNLRF